MSDALDEVRPREEDLSDSDETSAILEDVKDCCCFVKEQCHCVKTGSRKCKCRQCNCHNAGRCQWMTCSWSSLISSFHHTMSHSSSVESDRIHWCWVSIVVLSSSVLTRLESWSSSICFCVSFPHSSEIGHAEPSMLPSILPMLPTSRPPPPIPPRSLLRILLLSGCWSHSCRRIRHGHLLHIVSSMCASRCLLVTSFPFWRHLLCLDNFTSLWQPHSVPSQFYSSSLSGITLMVPTTTYKLP